MEKQGRGRENVEDVRMKGEARKKKRKCGRSDDERINEEEE